MIFLSLTTTTFLTFNLNIVLWSTFLIQGAESHKISGKPCTNALGEEGTCLFAWECIQSEGKRLGTCSEGFLIGMCCGDIPKREVTSSTPPITTVTSSTTFTPSPGISPETFTEVPVTRTNSRSSTTVSQEFTTPSSQTVQPNRGFLDPLKQFVTTQFPEIFSTSYPTVGPESLSDSVRTQRPDQLFNPFNTLSPFSSDVTTQKNAATYQKELATTLAPFLTTLPEALTTFLSNDLQPVTTWSSADENKPDTFTEFPMTEETTVFNAETEGTTLQNIETTKEPSPETSSSSHVTSTSSPPIVNNTISDGENVSNLWSTTTRPYMNKLDCGMRPLKPMRPQGRVVGGRNAYFGEWPWQVLIKEATWLGLFVKTKCGGVLIDHRWVLTAAHCQPGFLGSLVVIVGEYDLTGDFENLKPVAKPVRRMIVHRNYKPETFENDIALLELDSGFEVQPHVVPICLPEPDSSEDYVGHVGHVAGWGKLSYGGPVPSILQVVRLPIIPNAQCQKMFHAAGHDKVIRSTFICAGYTDGGKDSCEGDSGGPLMIQSRDHRWTLIGTVSHGIKCAEPNLPGVYMRTSTYLPWIKSIMKRYPQK